MVLKFVFVSFAQNWPTICTKVEDLLHDITLAKSYLSAKSL